MIDHYVAFEFPPLSGCDNGPYTFCLNGHNHHRIRTLLPTHADGLPRFAQLYIYDTENEVDNQIHALNLTIADNNSRLLLQYLIAMLNLNNPLVQSFCMARERFNGSSMQPVTLCLLGTRQRNAREYNLPTTYEVAALVPGNSNPMECRDVIVEERRTDDGHNPVKRISELHPSFMALQYPLLFPYGEDGFQLEIPLNVPPTTKRKYMSLREYYCFRLQCRTEEGKTLHKAGRLFHTYCVDAYTAVLDHDLDWYKRNQNTIRSELYHRLHDRIASGETNIQSLGRNFILPLTFTGGPRHMIQQYRDAMAICRWAGPPDLFETMTCNRKCPEIERDVENYIPGLPATDRPDTITRVFKMKLDDLVEDIQKGHHFGRVKAGVYLTQCIYKLAYFENQVIL
ncbi:putative PIF1 DNA helicase/replication protein A1-like protein [Tanacetum coccineum]